MFESLTSLTRSHIALNQLKGASLNHLLNVIQRNHWHITWKNEMSDWMNI
jgi:hypothetical protein